MKATIVALAAAVAGAFALFAALVPSDVRLRLRLRGTPEAVWDAITDVRQYPRWRRDVESVVTPTDVHWEEAGPGGLRSGEVLFLEPHRHWAIRRTDASGSTVWLFELEPDGEGCSLTISLLERESCSIFGRASSALFGTPEAVKTYVDDLAARLGDRPVLVSE
jgi:uncharacterized protein YndB with AHSA1/START domain